MPVSKFILEESKGTSAVQEIASNPNTLTLAEYLRSNMKLFLKSRKNIKEIYQVLKMEGIFQGSYSWFARIFSREKRYYLKNGDGDKEEIVMAKKPLFIAEEKNENTKNGDPDKEEIVMADFMEKNFLPTAEENNNDNKIPEKYKLKYRANLEVPLGEVQEALDAGARIEDEYQNYTGIIYALGQDDVRCFQKWLPKNICKRYNLEYQEKENIATKAEVIELLNKLKLNHNEEA